MYTVYDYRKHIVLGTYATAKKARARVEKADRAYGACTALVRWASAEEALTQL